MKRSSLRGLVELGVLLLGAWLSLASSEDEPAAGSSPAPVIPTTIPCTANTECPGFVADLCQPRMECRVGVCTQVVLNTCTAVPGVCEEPGCDKATGDCFIRPKPDTAGCDDGNTCTENDQCSAGQCVSQPVQCPPNGPCAAYSCVPGVGGCQAQTKPEGTVCNDGDKCTGPIDQCTGGQCLGGVLNCNDGNACTQDACNPAVGCTHNVLADGNPCEDENHCTIADLCQGGVCVSGPANDGATCEDADECTAGTTCSGTVCGGGTKTVCPDDNRECTNDECQPNNGCSYPVDLQVVCTPTVGSGCFLTGFCKEPDFCQGTSPAAAGAPCDDGKPCTLGDNCNGSGECTVVLQLAGAPCEDGNPCSTAEVCDAFGSCVSQQSTVCNDANECTADSCHEVNGCVYGPVGFGTPCEDGSECTFGTACDAGATCSGGVQSCDDELPCTTDACVGKVCTHTPVAGGTPCDGQGGCQGGFCDGTPQCVYGAAPSCDDGSACTADGCNPNSGCTNTPLVCDDGDPCTANDCKPATGCANTVALGGLDCPLESDCSDGLDNDKDGLVDCAARGCYRSVVWCAAKNATPYSADLDGKWLPGFGAVNAGDSGWAVDASPDVTPVVGPLTLNFNGAAGTPITGNPPTSYFGSGKASAFVCCWDSPPAGMFATWLEWVDLDPAVIALTRQVRVILPAVTPAEPPTAPYPAVTLPTTTGLGHWIRRKVAVPGSIKFGISFDVAIPDAAAGDPGLGWFIDDLKVLLYETCDGAADLNGDGKLGCADPLCREYAGCEELACENTTDDNGDGLTDCDDQDCWGRPDICE